MDPPGANADKTDRLDFAQPAYLLLEDEHDKRPAYHSAHIYRTSIKIDKKKRDKRCLYKKIQAIHM